MLKAVRFDEELHKDLLKYIEDFRDHKGRKNESEAIRALMTKGLEYINNKHQPSNQQVNVEQITQDILNQVMATLNQNQPKQHHQPINNDIQVKMNTVETKEIVQLQPKKQNPVINDNPLLSNLLGNIKK